MSDPKLTPPDQLLVDHLEDLDMSPGERLELGHRRFVARIREREEAARAAAEGAKP